MCWEYVLKKINVSLAVLLILALGSLVLFVFTAGNVWLDSDAAGYLMQSAEIIRHGTLFPEVWHDSTYIHLHTLPTVAMYALTGNMILARDLASVFSIAAVFLAALFLGRYGLRSNSWLLIMLLLFSYLSDTQYSMLYTDAYYTQFLLSLLVVLAFWLHSRCSVRILSVNSILLLVSILISCALGEMRTLQQVVLPLIAATWIVRLEEGNSVAESNRQERRLVLFIGMVAALSAAGCYLYDNRIASLFGVAGNMQDELASYSATYESILANYHRIIQGFLYLSGIPVGVPMFSLAGIAGVIRAMVFLIMTFIFPIRIFIRRKKIDLTTRAMLYFALINAAEIVFILLLGHGSDSKADGRYMLIPILLLQITSCHEIYKRFLGSERKIRHTAVIFIAASALTLTAFSLSEIRTSDERLAERTELVDYLEEQDLRYGYASFWNASTYTALSNEKVKIRNVSVQSMRVKPQLWLSSETWYDPHAYSGRTFLLLTEQEKNAFTAEETEDGYYGTPVQFLEFDDYYIFVYDYNIAENHFLGKNREWDLLRTVQSGGYLENDRLIIPAEEMMSGPYFTVESGRYELCMDLGWKDKELKNLSMSVTANQGDTTIETFDLKQGENSLKFSLDKETPDLSFVIQNNSDEDIIVREIVLRADGTAD